jgi:alpha-L-fucosidase
LYTFDIGQNDLTAGYFANKTVEQVETEVPEIISQFMNAIKVGLSVSDSDFV